MSSPYTFEDLIESVKRRPQIWARSSTGSSNQARKNGWVQISKELKTGECRLKNSWKYLVDQYRRELKANSCLQKNNPGASVWAYYNKMSFMKDEILTAQRRRLIRERIMSDSQNSRSNVESPHQENHEPHQENPDSPHQENYVSPHQENHDLTLQDSDSTISITNDHKTNSFSQYKTKKESPNPKPSSSSQDISKADLIIQKLDSLSSDMKDSDFMFFMSILPMIRTLSPVKKLQLRGKINAWMLEMIEDEAPKNVEVLDPMDDQEVNCAPWSPREDNKESVLMQMQIFKTEDD